MNHFQPDYIVPIVRFQAGRHSAVDNELVFYACSARWEDIRAAWFERIGQMSRAAAHFQAAETYSHLACSKIPATKS